MEVGLAESGNRNAEPDIAIEKAMWGSSKNGFQSFNFTMSEEYPAVQGGGSLILAWQIRNKKVLVVGGGEVILSD